VPCYFFDTSAVVKRYRPEDGTAAIDAIFADEAAVRFLSRLGVVETISALATKVRTGELTPEDYAVARKKFLGDLSAGSMSSVRLLVGHYRMAEQFVDRHAVTRRLRILDALQLSVAIDLRDQRRLDVFVCADEALCEIARQEGLSKVNPGVRA
jgi:predicted nucleic acid-binding protein